MKRLRRKPINAPQTEGSPFFPPIQKKEMTVEDEGVQTKKEEDEPVQKKEEEEALQKKEAKDEFLQKEEKEEPIQKAETDEDPIQKQEEEQEKPIQKAEKEEEKPIMTKRENSQQGNTSLEKKLATQQGKGTSMDDGVMAEMERGLGADFSNVNIHTGTAAVAMNELLGSQAFTQGANIYFNTGKYDPSSQKGKHLLAHELTHTMQQNAVNSKESTTSAKATPSIQRQLHSPNVVAMTDADIALEIIRTEAALAAETSSNEEADDLRITLQILRDEEAERTTLAPQLDRITSNYMAMIASARSIGFAVGADNLQHFLTGGGQKRTLSAAWLRAFLPVISAEETNQDRFQTSLNTIANRMVDGETRVFNDYWDRGLTGDVTTELFYASGDSTITSTGGFTLTRTGDVVTISGTVDHRWWDIYDWHANLATYIPGHGTVSDADALLLQRYRQALPFDMEGNWQKSLSGSITVREYLPNSVNLTWA